jgi:ketosteroid isomerase-like protein
MKVAVAALALLFCACSHATIANTPVQDTKENREILTVLSKYKLAVEAKDIDAVMALVSTDYLDVSVPGKTGALKDYAQLRSALKDEFEKTRSIRIELHPREVKVEADKAQIDYYYVVRFDPVLPTGTQWHSETDDARMRLRRQQGEWKITSGL